MKVIILLSLLVFATPLLADETSEMNLSSPGAFQHTHTYEEYDNPVGLGLDAVLYRPTDTTAVLGEARYDFNNEVFSLFGVFSVDLSDVLQR